MAQHTLIESGDSVLIGIDAQPALLKTLPEALRSHHVFRQAGAVRVDTRHVAGVSQHPYAARPSGRAGVEESPRLEPGECQAWLRTVAQVQRFRAQRADRNMRDGMRL